MLPQDDEEAERLEERIEQDKDENLMGNFDEESDNEEEDEQVSGIYLCIEYGFYRGINRKHLYTCSENAIILTPDK